MTLHLPSQKDDDPENPKDTTPGAGAGQVEIGKIMFQKQRVKIVSFDLLYMSRSSMILHPHVRRSDVFFVLQISWGADRQACPHWVSMGVQLWCRTPAKRIPNSAPKKLGEKKTSTSKCAIRNIHNLCVYIYTVQVYEYYMYIYMYVCIIYIYVCIIYIICTIYIYICICVSVCVGMGQNLLLPYLGV